MSTISIPLFLCHLKRVSLFIIFLLGSTSYSLAQENIRFERISTNEGLSQADVWSMCEDNFGFLWVGTRDGLNKYDGHTFFNYHKNKKDSLSLFFNNISALQIDSIGNIWIGSIGGISMYDYATDRFKNYLTQEPALRYMQVHHITLLGNTVLLSTNKGLISFDPANNRFFIDPLFEMFKGSDIFYTHCSEDATWLCTNNGLYVISKTKSDTGRTPLLKDIKTNHIYFDTDNMAYICTANGLFKYDVKEEKLSELNLPAGIRSVSKVLRLKDGNLWIAAEKVVILDSTDRIRFVLEHDPNNNYSLSHNSARTIFQTSDDVVWVGNGGFGLNKFNPDITVFSHLSHTTSIPLSSDYVTSIYTEDDSVLLIGLLQGIDKIDLKTRSSKRVDGFSEKVFKINVDRTGIVWVASEKGFKQYSNGKIISRNNTLKNVIDFAEWDRDHILLLTEEMGAFLFNRTTYKISNLIPDDSSHEAATCMLVESDKLWVGYNNGLKLYSHKGELKDYFQGGATLSTLNGSFIKSLYRDTRGNLWIGTWGGGLSLFRDGKFTNYGVDKGLPNSVVYGILEDHLGLLWLSTNLGLSAFNQKEQSFRNFDFSDGLQGNEFNTEAHFKSLNGYLYFGGINGLTFFNPEAVIKQHTPPSILVTGITVNNKPFDFHNSTIKNILFSKQIDFAAGENDIGLEFTAIDFKHSGKNNFQYSISDTSWYNIGNRRSFELINLNNGLHKVKIRAKAPGTGWSSDSALLSVYVPPSFWERTWFRIIVIILVLVLIVLVYWYREKRLVQMNTTLNKIVEDRTKEIHAKNEEIAAQHEGIMLQNKELKKQKIQVEEKNSLLNEQHRQLLTLRNELEKKVEERVKDIQLLNKDLLDQNIQLEQFSFIVAHNFRSPVARIKGLFNILPADVLANKSTSEIFEYLRMTIEDMEAVILDVNKILAIKRHSKDSFEVVDLRETLEKTLLVLAEDISAKNIEIDTDLFESLEINGYKAYVQSIFFNLIQNAIKFSKNNVPRKIQITCYQDENKITIEFIDNGIGINLEVAWNKIFRLYQRFTYGSTGRGFGLFLAKTQVEQMGGQISVESTLGEGTRFTITFPEIG